MTIPRLFSLYHYGKYFPFYVQDVHPFRGDRRRRRNPPKGEAAICPGQPGQPPCGKGPHNPWTDAGHGHRHSSGYRPFPHIPHPQGTPAALPQECPHLSERPVTGIYPCVEIYVISGQAVRHIQCKAVTPEAVRTGDLHKTLI